MIPTRPSLARSRLVFPAVVAAVAAVSWLSWPLSVAEAEALVTVQLKDKSGAPADGKVELRGDDDKPLASCEARAGKCEMQNVPGGSFTVTVTPVQGPPPKPRKVMIPPSGKVTLVLSTG